jgi:SNF2 family DNA or RNA helicase
MDKYNSLRAQLELVKAKPSGFTTDEYNARVKHYEYLVMKQAEEAGKHNKVCEYFMTGINEIDAIVKRNSIQPADVESDENTCKICWGAYNLPIAYFKVCGHYFCKCCIDGLKESINSSTINECCCPMCRRDIKLEDIIYVNEITDINYSSKIHELLTLIKPDQKYIIFTQFDSVIDNICSFLERNHILASTLDSYTDETILLLSSGRNAEGINLSHIDNMIIFEPFDDSVYSTEVEKQLIARIHRVGRQAPVNIYRLITKDTIEEDIYKRCVSL